MLLSVDATAQAVASCRNSGTARTSNGTSGMQEKPARKQENGERRTKWVRPSERIMAALNIRGCITYIYIILVSRTVIRRWAGNASRHRKHEKITNNYLLSIIFNAVSGMSIHTNEVCSIPIEAVYVSWKKGLFLKQRYRFYNNCFNLYDYISLVIVAYVMYVRTVSAANLCVH